MVEFGTIGKQINIADVSREVEIVRDYSSKLGCIYWADVEHIYLNEMSGKGYNIVTNNCQDFTYKFYQKILAMDSKRKAA